MNKKKSFLQKSSHFKVHARLIIREAIDAVDPGKLVLNQLKVKNNQLRVQGSKFNLAQFKKIHVIGAGKAVPYLYMGLKKLLGNWISGGIIISTNLFILSDKKIKFYSGNHPVPSKKNFYAGKKVIEYISNQVSPEDLVFVLITGGASALLCYPWLDFDVKDKIRLNQELLSSSATIREINCVRKHFSALKGGRLAVLIYPAQIITLILSDIISSPLDDIGSGPSVGDSTTFFDANRILHKYNMIQKLSPKLINHIERGMKKQITETPSPKEDIFKKNHHFLLGDNNVFLQSAKKSAERNGIKTIILTSSDRGEASEIAKLYASIISEIIHSQQPFTPPVLLLSSGELTITLKGNGKGGRNQEFVLQMLKELKEVKHPFFVLSIDTDGIDGSTDAAGAWIDEKTIKKSRKFHLDPDIYLQKNNSYVFFKKINQLIKTGPTKTNVMDFRMFYIP